MAEELMTQITKAINEQLPAHIGDVLRKRLETAASDANRVAELDKQNGELRFEVDKLKTELKIYDDLGKRRSELDRLKAETDAKLLKLEISELKVEQAAVRVKDMKEVVGMVFANNRYKYTECSSRQVPGDPGSYLHYASDSKSIESEG